MKNSIVTLDVREDIKSGREPFSTIMETLKSLKPEEGLRLVAPFEPVPLIHLLAKQGFSPSSTRRPDGDWEITFIREDRPVTTSQNQPALECGCDSTTANNRQVIDLDARGLEPPQPLVKILGALSELPVGVELRARTDRRPVHLHPLLESRGFIGQTTEAENGSYITHIRRN